jgi:hypothetical protein
LAAQRDFELWLDQARHLHYEPRAQANATLLVLAKQHIQKAEQALTRIFHKLSGFSRLARVPEEKLDWTALVFRFRQNLGLIPL